MDILEGGSAQCSDWELVNLLFPGSAGENEAVWLVGTYVAWVWKEVYIHGNLGSVLISSLDSYTSNTNLTS